jgi:putative Holliday junction resolvase
VCIDGVPGRGYNGGVKVLGLDLGEKRVGVAVSDPNGTVAHPLKQIEVRGRRDLVEQVARLVAETAAERVVVGMPVRLDGQAGAQARRVEATVEALRETLAVPVETWDERLSTRQADRSMQGAGLSADRRRAKRDMVAAALILQSYLDARPPRG